MLRRQESRHERESKRKKRMKRQVASEEGRNM